MIPAACKRLAEVDFPIAEVSRHAAREKSIRHGHPSTLHLWWARRPLASSRAGATGAAPADPYSPEAFKTRRGMPCSQCGAGRRDGRLPLVTAPTRCATSAGISGARLVLPVTRGNL